MALLTTACGDYSDLAFRQDDRLTFTPSHNRELTETPLQLSWRISNFSVLPPGATSPVDDEHGYFAVFLDRAPVKPRRTLADVFDDGQPCSEATCGNKLLLAERGVYVTRKPALVLRDVPRLGAHDDTQLHEVVVILLDAEGRRIGEAAWYDAFKLEHEDPND